MSILTLENYTPPARFDNVAWTAARIEQSTTETGSFALVESIDLDPPISDPTDPGVYSFTTELATAGDWYRVVWVDENAALSDPTAPVQLLDETTDTLGDRTELATRLKISETANATALDRCLQAASLEIVSEIGRADLSGWERALADEVALERAAEHWNQLTSPFGFVGVGVDTPLVAGRDSWERHAIKLAPLKASWGIA